MSYDKLKIPSSELTSAEYLLNHFDKDIQTVYNQMQLLEIAFHNLQGSWIAISQVHKVMKVKSEKED